MSAEGVELLAGSPFFEGFDRSDVGRFMRAVVAHGWSLLDGGQGCAAKVPGLPGLPSLRPRL